MVKCITCGDYYWDEFGESCRCKPYTVFYPDYFRDCGKVIYSNSFEGVAKKLAEKINCEDPVFDEDIFEVDIKIVSKEGVAKMFNCIAEVDIAYHSRETKPTKITVEFYGIDSWNRPIFKDVDRKEFYGSTDKLYSDTEMEKAKKEVTVEDLLYFGTHFGCEPMGTPAPNLVIKKDGK